MSWRNELSQNIKDDIDKLYNQSLDSAVYALSKNKRKKSGFPPYGMTLLGHGEIRIALVEYFPKSADAVDFLIKSYQEHRDEYKAVSIIFHVKLENEDKGIYIFLEHIEGAAVSIIVPYKRKGFFEKKIILNCENSVSKAVSREVWIPLEDIGDKQTKNIN